MPKSRTQRPTHDAQQGAAIEQQSPVVPALVPAAARGRGGALAGSRDGSGGGVAPLPSPSDEAESPCAGRGLRAGSPAGLPVRRPLLLDPPPSSTRVGLGLGLPVELDELLEAGESFTGFGALAAAAPAMSSSEAPPSASRSPRTPQSTSPRSDAVPSPPRPPRSLQRTLSTSTSSTHSHTGSSSLLGSPRAGVGSQTRGPARWSAASTVATSVHPDDEAADGERTAAPASPLPTTPSLCGSSPSGDHDAPLARPRAVSFATDPHPAVARGALPPLPVAPSAPPPPHPPLPLPSRSALRARAPRQSSASSSSAGSASPLPRPSPPSVPSSFRSQGTLLPTYSHARADAPPRLSPPQSHWDAPWAPPDGLDDEEREVLGLMPILQPGMGLLPFEEDDSAREAEQRVQEQGWAGQDAGGAELRRSLVEEVLPLPPAHPFLAQGYRQQFGTPGVQPLEATESAAAVPSAAQPPPLPTSASSSTLSPPSSSRTRRTSMLSSLAAPFAGLSRSRSTGSATSGGLAPPVEGGGESSSRGRGYRLSVIGEASSPSPSPSRGGQSASAGSSSTSLSSGSGSRRRLRRSSGLPGPESASSLPLQAGTEGSQVQYPSADAARQELEGMNGKAAKLLGLSVASQGAPAGRSAPPSLHGPSVSRTPTAGEWTGERNASGEGALPSWPARKEELQGHEVLSADLYKLGSAPTSLFRSTTRVLFRPRFVSLTAAHPHTAQGDTTSYHLHAFKSRHPSERETSRLQLTPASVVCVPAAMELPARSADGRSYAVKVTGRNTPTMNQTGAATSWVIGMDDEAIFREWLERLKDAVRELSGPQGAQQRLSTGPGGDFNEPFDLDWARRAADEASRARAAAKGSVESGVGDLVLTSQGWQLEVPPTGRYGEGSERGRTRARALGSGSASASFTTRTSLDDDDDVDSSSFSGQSSLHSRRPSFPSPPVATTSAAAGLSFLDAGESSGDDSPVDEPLLFQARSVRRHRRSKRTSEQASVASRESAHSHAHLAPPLPPPSSALPPLPPHPRHDGPDRRAAHLLQRDLFDVGLPTASTTSLPAPIGRHGRQSYLSSHSADSLPPPLPPPRVQLPPVPPSPDLAQLERELARRMPSRTRSETRNQ